jgi:hypothetical protein
MTTHPGHRLALRLFRHLAVLRLHARSQIALFPQAGARHTGTIAIYLVVAPHVLDQPLRRYTAGAYRFQPCCWAALGRARRDHSHAQNNDDSCSSKCCTLG